MKFISSHNPPEYIQRILTEFSHRGYWVIPDYQDKDDDVIVLINDQRYLHDTEFKLNHKVWFILDQHINEQLLDSKTIVKISKVLVLSNEQQKYLKQHPLFQSFDALVICPGIDPYVLPSLRECLEPRDPKRIIWTNEPRKGLTKAIQIFKEMNDPEATMEVCCDIHDAALPTYQKEAAGYNIIFTKYANRIEGYLKASVWFNPVLHDELFPERCIEAQAMGTIPVSTRVSSNETYMRYGFDLTDCSKGNFISGCANILSNVLNNGIDQTKRFETIEGARNQYNYYRTVDRLEAHLVGNTSVKNLYQYSFQLRWAEDPLINIGCNVDAPQLGERPGAVNVDAVAFDKHLNSPTAATVIADARDLPDELYNKFACAILGDILEHMTDEDAIKCLIEAGKCIVDDGHVIVTCPEDYSYVNGLHGPPKQADPEYVTGVNSFHKDPVTCDRIKLWAEKAGLNILRWDVMGYYNSKGHGLLLSKGDSPSKIEHKSKVLELPKKCDIQDIVKILNEIDIAKTETNILLNAVYRSSPIDGMVCEIGIREGHSTFLILEVLRNIRKSKIHIAIDPYGHLDYLSGSSDTTVRVSKEDYTNRMKARTLKNLHEYCDKYQVECLFFPLEDSEFFVRYQDGVPVYDEHKRILNTYSLVVLDGPHYLQSVRNEFDYFKNRMTPGGFIVFDDIDKYKHVELLDKYVQSCGYKLMELGKIKASYMKL